MAQPTSAAPDPVTERRSLYSRECLEALARWDGIDGPPDSENRRQREGIPIFNNRALEVCLTKAPPILPWIWGVPIMAFGIWLGHARHGIGWGVISLLFVAGIFLWTLIEYLLHRFFFHFMPKNRHIKMFFFLTHGYHHEFPDDKMRLVAPPLMFWTLALIFGVVYYLLFGQTWWAPLFSGTVAGYLIYDSIHFYAHHAHPKSVVGKYLRSYHLLHHFDDVEVRYGISSPLWDLVFGTFRGLKKNG